MLDECWRRDLDNALSLLQTVHCYNNPNNPNNPNIG